MIGLVFDCLLLASDAVFLFGSAGVVVVAAIWIKMVPHVEKVLGLFVSG